MQRPHLSKSSGASQLPTKEQLELELEQERLLIKRAERQQAQNLAYRGRIAVFAFGALLVVAIPMAFAAMLAQVNDPTSLSAPLLLLSGGGALGGGIVWKRQSQPGASDSDPDQLA